MFVSGNIKKVQCSFLICILCGGINIFGISCYFGSYFGVGV